MIDLDIRLEQADQAVDKFKRLAKVVKDLRPVWKRFVPWYNELVKTEFEQTRGKIMQGSTWANYVDSYAKRKGRKSANLVVTGALKRAATGRDNNFINIQKRDSLTIGIKGIDYAWHVQERSKNPRRYFTNEENKIPLRAARFLVSLIEDEIEKAVK